MDTLGVLRMDSQTDHAAMCFRSKALDVAKIRIKCDDDAALPDGFFEDDVIRCLREVYVSCAHDIVACGAKMCHRVHPDILVAKQSPHELPTLCQQNDFFIL